MTSGQAISKLKHDKKYTNDVIRPLGKEHKALEIIKKKWLDFELFEKTNNVEEYNNHCLYEHQVLTQKEYKLLKEVLL